MNKIYYILSLLLLTTLCGCEDRLEWNGAIPEGISNVTFRMSFDDFSPALQDSRSSGDAIKAIEKLWVVVYDTDGNYIQHQQIGDFTIVKNDRPDGSPSTEEKTGHAEFNLVLANGRYHIYAVANCNLTDDDVATEDALKSKTLQWQTGQNLNATSTGQPNKEMFGYFSNTTAEQSKMPEGFGPDLVIVNGVLPVHAWLRRAASKLTIAFDTQNLKENVYIYLQSVQIRDIPRECYLGKDNQPGKEGNPAKEQVLYHDGEIMFFKGAKAGQDPKADHGKWTMLPAEDTNIWGMNSEKNTPYPGADDPAKPDENRKNRLKHEHSEAAPALYFYENRQPRGNKGEDASDKRQDITGENKQVSYPEGTDSTKTAWKDARPYGSYVEIKGYYVSNDDGRPGQGPITYRFMLGKNTVDDYDAERNYHYQLTMKFNGYANDVDFHIDYREESKPGPYSPDITYVSYSYNQPAHTVFRGTPRQGYKMTSLDVYILKNEWRPYSEDGTELSEPIYNSVAWNMQMNKQGYYSGGDAWKVSNNKAEEDPNCEFGFLSLRAVKDVDIDMGGRDHANGNLEDRIKRFRISYTRNASENAGKPLSINATGPGKYPKGRRTYRIDNVVTYGTPTNGPVDADIDADEANDGNAQVNYEIVPKGDPNTKADDEHNYIFTIPLYTRAKSLDSWCVYSGANAFYQHYRYAKIKFVAHYENVNNSKDKYADSTYTNVLQSRRVDNPRGIIRDGGNTEPFEVELMFSTLNADNIVTGFSPVVSRGPWTAIIEKDPNNLVQLTGNGQTATGEKGMITGKTNTKINFTYTPRHTVDNSNSEGALIKVQYHNNSCVHYIIVRQGYGPVRLVDGGMNWSAFNVFDESHLTVNPLSSGSLFRRYWKLNKPISTDNNKTYGLGALPSETYRFRLAPLSSKRTATWNLEKDKRDENCIPYMPSSETNAFGEFTMSNGIKYKAPSGSKFKAIIANTNTTNTIVDFAFGIVYGNGATKTLSTTAAWSFTDPNNIITESDYGARGVVAYNNQTGANIFFPFGQYGHARRKCQYWTLSPDYVSFNITDGNGTLRYGSLDVRLGGTMGQHGTGREYNDYRPMAYNLPDQEGGVYWFGEKDGNDIAADFNYGNYMTGVLGASNLYTRSEFDSDGYYYIGPGHGQYNYSNGNFIDVGVNKGSYLYGNPTACDAVPIKPVRAE